MDVLLDLMVFADWIISAIVVILIVLIFKKVKSIEKVINIIEQYLRDTNK